MRTVACGDSPVLILDSECMGARPHASALQSSGLAFDKGTSLLSMLAACRVFTSVSRKSACTSCSMKQIAKPPHVLPYCPELTRGYCGKDAPCSSLQRLPGAPQLLFLCAQFYELARKEIGALILSDEHPNIVRCFAMEEDDQFVYLALERCRHSLADLLSGAGGPPQFVDDARRPTPFCLQVGEGFQG